MLSHSTEYSTDGGSNWVLHTASEPVGPDKTITLVGLAPGTYNMRLRITPTTGDGPPVTSDIFELTITAELQCSVVSFATVTAALSGTAHLSGATSAQSTVVGQLALKIDGATSGSSVATAAVNTAIKFSGAIVVSPSITTAAATTKITATSTVSATASTLTGLLNDLVINAAPTATVVFSNFEASAVVADTTPVPFTFQNLDSVGSWGELITSEDKYPTGMDAATPISISGDATAKYSIGIGAFVSTPGTINPGQRLRLQLYSSTTSYGTNSCTITVGTYSTTWTLTSGE